MKQIKVCFQLFIYETRHLPVSSPTQTINLSVGLYACRTCVGRTHVEDRVLVSQTLFQPWPSICIQFGHLRHLVSCTSDFIRVHTKKRREDFRTKKSACALERVVIASETGCDSI
jgi:hypothetical protein